MTTRDYNAERYNRRTRAIERQAAAMEAIGDALREQAAAAKVSALAAAAQTKAPTVNSSWCWTTPTGTELMDNLLAKARDL